MKWHRSDRLVKGWLTATLSEEVLGIVIGLSTAGKVWNALVHAFARVSPDRSLALKRRLTTITRGTDTLSVFLRKFKTICDELATIGKPVLDHKKSWWLLNGLGKEYEVFTATMLRPPIPPYAEIVTHLESYADRYKLDTPATSPMVFYGQKQNKNKKNQGQQVSFNSKGRGFIQGNQSKFKPYNFQSRGQSSNQNANNKNKDEVVVCQICNKRNHTAIKCFNRFNHSFTVDNLPQSFAAMKLSDIQDSAWHPDTGATDHMTGNAGKHPDYGTFRILGSRCFPYLGDYRQHKLEPKSLPCVFLGYSSKHRGYKCLYPPTGRIYISRHVVFDESILPYSQPTCLYGHEPVEGELCTFSEWENFVANSTTSTSSNPSPPLTAFAPPPSPIDSQLSFPQPPPASPQLDPEVRALSENDSPISEQLATVRPQPIQHTMLTRSKVGIRKPNPKYANFHVVHEIPAVPKSVIAAKKHLGWSATMDEELAALSANQTWTLVPRRPEMNVVGCKWVYKAKLQPNGSLERLKARLVAKGFNQVDGVDFSETFSPIIKRAHIRVVLTIAVVKRWELRQLDVKNAFLHGHLSAPIYMQQPPGYVDPACPTHVCQLSRALYGLKQAPRAWFYCSITDPSLFICHSSGGVLILLMYVDDMVVTGDNPNCINWLLNQLAQQFSIKDLGFLHHFLGIEVHKIGHNLFLS